MSNLDFCCCCGCYIAGGEGTIRENPDGVIEAVCVDCQAVLDDSAALHKENEDNDD